MKSLIQLALTLLLIPLSTISVMAQECRPQVPRKTESLLILPLTIKAKNGFPEIRTLSILIPILLKDYLSQSKKISLLPIPPGQTSPHKAEAKYLFKGALSQGAGSYLYHISLLSMATASQKEIYHSEGKIDFPSKINDALIPMTEQVANALGFSLPTKKLLPFLNLSNSSEAYRHFAEGRMALQSDTIASSENAIQSFEETVKHDYNYVPGYLGLAEALAIRASWGELKNHQEEDKWRQRARVELEKAKILNPVLTKERQGQIEWYLDHTCKGEISR